MYGESSSQYPFKTDAVVSMFVVKGFERRDVVTVTWQLNCSTVTLRVLVDRAMFLTSS